MSIWQQWLRSKWRRRLSWVVSLLLIPVLIWIAFKWGWQEAAIPVLIGIPILLVVVIGLDAYGRHVSRRFGPAAAHEPEDGSSAS